MLVYTEYKGVILNRYEWAGGLGMTHKEVATSQAARRRELKRKQAVLIDFD